MLPDLSVGSSTSVPTEFWSRLSGLICFQVGWPESALVVSQTPPPEAPAQRRHLWAEHFGSTTRAVIRLAVLLVAPENDVTPGWVASICGPSCFHWPLQRKLRECSRFSLWSRVTIRAKVLCARATTEGGSAEADGYVRSAERYAS